MEKLPEFKGLQNQPDLFDTKLTQPGVGDAFPKLDAKFDYRPDRSWMSQPGWLGVPDIVRRESLAQVKINQAQNGYEAFLARGDEEVAKLLAERRKIREERLARLQGILDESMQKMQTPPPAPRDRRMDLGELLALALGGFAGGQMGASMGEHAIKSAEQRRQEQMEADRLNWQTQIENARLRYNTVLQQMAQTEASLDRLDELDIARLQAMYNSLGEYKRGLEVAERQYQQQLSMMFLGDQLERDRAKEFALFKAKLDEEAGSVVDKQKLIQAILDPGTTPAERMAALAELKRTGFQPSPELESAAMVSGTLAEGRQALTEQRQISNQYLPSFWELKLESMRRGLPLTDAQVQKIYDDISQNAWARKMDVLGLMGKVAGNAGQSVTELQNSLAGAQARLEALKTTMLQMLVKAGLKFEDLVSGNIVSADHPVLFKTFQEFLDTMASIRSLNAMIRQKKAGGAVDPAAVFSEVFKVDFSTLAKAAGLKPSVQPKGKGPVPPFDPLAPGVTVEGGKSPLSGPIGKGKKKK